MTWKPSGKEYASPGLRYFGFLPSVLELCCEIPMKIRWIGGNWSSGPLNGQKNLI